MTNIIREAYDIWHSSIVEDHCHAPWHDLCRDHLDFERDVRNKRVLEIGCGRGAFSCWLSEQGATVIGADFSPAAVNIARQRATRQGASTHFQVEDIQAMSFADNTFDTVFSLETLEHVPDAPRALRELARVLKPGGRLFVTNPNYFSSIGVYRFYYELTGRVFREHGQPINNWTMLYRQRAWMRQAGLSVEFSDAVGYYIPIPRRKPVDLTFLHRWRFLRRFTRWLGCHILTVGRKP